MMEPLISLPFPVPFSEWVLQPSATGLLLPSAEAVGVNYENCIRMTEALTDWETANGATMTYENVGTPWIEIVERCVDALI
jgi:hypothetical protein